MPDPAEDAARERHLRTVAKRELRSRMRQVRGVLPASAAAARSSAATERALALPELQGARVLVGFSAIHKELDPAALLAAARAQGKRVGLPRVVGELLELHEVSAPEELVEGTFGVLEPPASAPRIEPTEVDLVLVPALAFDARGHRIGYGRGFYDRLLPQLTRAFRVGLAYDFQLLAELPDDPHDVPMQCVVTDKRSLRF